MNKDLKKKAKANLKKNYWHAVAICFFLSIILGNFSFSSYNTYETRMSVIKMPFVTHFPNNIAIVHDTINGFNKIKKNITEYKPTKGLFATFFNNITSSESFIFGFLDSLNQLIFKNKIWLSITMFIASLLTLAWHFLVINAFQVGKRRFFLENANHPKTPFNRIFLPFRTGHYLNVCKVYFKKNLYEVLWWFTIVGGIIKHYEYALIPYLLAENPGIKSKEAFILSKNMTNNHKWELFKIDCSFIIWDILDFLTFHLTSILYSKPLKLSYISNYYLVLIKDSLKNKIPNYKYLKDNELENNESIYPKDKYIYKENKKQFIKTTNYQKNYSLISIILMFFSASIIGYLWEVTIHYFQYGNIVNRGTLHGPWLPIYGWGAISLVILLKKYRKDPLKTLILSIVICGLLEYFTSLYLEIFKHASWWDYHGFFINLNGRICLEGLLAFGVGGCTFIYFIAPFLENIYIKFSKKVKTILCIVLIFLYIGDMVYTKYVPNIGEGISQTLKKAD